MTDAGPYWGNSNLPSGTYITKDYTVALTREIAELRAENERLKREVDYWVNLDAQALEAENERLRTVLLEARDSIAGEITFQRGGNGPWIPANADDPLLAIVEKIDATLA